MKAILPLIIMMTISTACQRQENAAEQENLTTPKTLMNVSYGHDSLQAMDIYLPAGRDTRSTRAIVLIHGGGWTSGSKSDFAFYIDTLRKRLPGYAIFNINYRLVNGRHLFPTQEQDVNAAIRHILSHADQYGFNRNNMALLGFSAGAHLALLQAYKYNQPEIRAVIDYFGPADLLSMYEKPWHPLVPMALQMITGTTPSVNRNIYVQSSPIHFINAGSAPTLILHGSNDQVVDVSQSNMLQQELEKWNVPHQLEIYKGERHGWWQPAAMQHAFSQVQSFLNKHM